MKKKEKTVCDMIGIIGGSGLENPKILSDFQKKPIKTPYGNPSEKFSLGKIGGIDVAVLSRHGKNHSLNPTQVPYRANIWAFKELGCTHIIAATACGSLREEIMPGDLVFPNQFIDWTKKREYTFFDNNQVAHIPMSEPFCPQLRNVLVQTAKQQGVRLHEKGTVITIEGPRFSTKAESHLFRLMGADVINMSTVPEVTLARELGICYQSVAMATDYDCWHDQNETVHISAVLNVMKQNAQNVTGLFLKTIPGISLQKNCLCASDAQNAKL